MIPTFLLKCFYDSEYLAMRLGRVRSRQVFGDATSRGDVVRVILVPLAGSAGSEKDGTTTERPLTGGPTSADVGPPMSGRSAVFN